MGSILPMSVFSPMSAVLPSDGSCSILDFFFDPASWRACQQALEVAQIQSVPQNAAAAGYPANVVQVAQMAADQQSSNAPADVANVASFYNAGQLTVTPFAWPWWAWALIAGGVSLVAVKVLK
jgi:hypothetical protein